MASVYGNILTACEALIESISSSITGTNTAAVRVRKRPVYLQGDPLPLIVVSPRTEAIDDYQFDNAAWLTYPVIVAVIQQGNFLYESLSYQLEAREAIRKKLSATVLSGAAEVFDFVSYNPSPVYDLGGLDKSFDVSVQEFTYKAAEVRNA